MTDPPAKRRKIRPNNVIALSNASKQAKVTQPVEAKVTEVGKTVKEAEKIVKQAEKKAEEEHRKAEEKTERKAARKAERKAARRVEKDLKKVEKRKNKQLDSIVKKSKPNVVEPIVPVLSTPAPKSYSSASDSDETDDEKRIVYARKIAAQKQTESKEVLPEKTTPKETVPKKTTPKETVPKKTTKKDIAPKKTAPDSDSDSDDTDSEAKRPVQKKRTKKPSRAANTRSDSESDSGLEGTTIELDSEHRKSSHLVSNRISFRKKLEYNKDLSAADNVRERLSDLFVPEVNDNYFISDSDSETDSGEDYEAKEYPSWQRKLDLKHNKDTDPWPTQRKFGYSDTLKLEKRIKKICRREGFTFHQVQEIFSSAHRGEYVRFFQKIAKPFPNVSLHALARQCKNMYHEKRKTGPWTEDEIEQLKELIKVYGTSPTVLAEYIDRSPKNISDYLFSHTSTDKKINKRWSTEEDELLARAACKLKNNKKMDFSTIEPLFEGTRTSKQIHARYSKIRHLIQPNGSLVESRKANPYEELKYLKRLFKQVKEHKLAEESQVDYTKDRGFVDKNFYLSNRAAIKGFEQMSIKDILNKLMDRQNIIIESRREEKLLGSDPEPDQE